MIDSSGEANVWSIVWVISEVYRQEEHAACIWGIVLDADVSTKLVRESSGEVSQAH